MTNKQILETVDKVFQAIFGQQCPWDLETLEQKMAFDIKLPAVVKDSTTGEVTYSAMPNAKKFITDKNSAKREDSEGWMLEKQPVKNLKKLIELWDSINYTMTERVYDSENVTASDPIYNSVNVHKSTNCGRCHNIVFCDSSHASDFAIACQRSADLNFCLRVDDSSACSNSYNVICSGKISNSLFIQDANNLHECIFCSHLANRKFCIANMQFEEKEYYALKAKIVEWILK